MAQTFAHYGIEALLCRRELSVAYRATDLRRKRKVSLTLLKPDRTEAERFRERFLRESELAAALDHPSIIPIYDAGEVDGVSSTSLWATSRAATSRVCSPATDASSLSGRLRSSHR